MAHGDLVRWTCCNAQWPGPHAPGCNGSSYVAWSAPTVSESPQVRIATAAERIATALERIAAALDAEREEEGDSA